MSFEEVIEQILSTRKDLTRERLLGMIKEKKKEAQEFFTDEAAARIVALELGVKIIQKSLQLKVPIGDLVSGLNDVTVTGRVVAIYPPRTFLRQDQTEGKFARLIITDKSGSLKVVLWNDNASLVETEKIEQGHIIKVLHGYVREGLDGKLEMHLGSRGKLQIVPSEAAKEGSPAVFTKINELKPKMRGISVLVRVVQVGDVREFRRSKDETGHMSTLLIKDETGYTSLNLWEDKAFISKGIQPGDIVLAQGAYTRERFGRLSLNVGRLGTATIDPKVSGVDKLPPYEEERTKISEIKEEGGPITISGIVASTPTIREVVTSRNEKATVVSLDLKDDTGIIGFSAWRKLAETARDLTIGTKIEIKNAYVRKGFGDQLELTSRMFTSVETSPKTERRYPTKTEELLS